MNLLLDIGNSRIKWCHHDNKENNFGLAGTMLHDNSRLDELFYENWSHHVCPDRVLASNVSGSDTEEKLDAWIKKAWQIDTEYVKTEAHSHGVRNAYPDYYKLGVDRWMAIIAAWHRYQSHREAICVVDCGTAMTIDGISRSGQHLGGLIIPGVTMMQEALVNNTSHINKIEMNTPSYEFSDSTDQAVISGCYLAMLATIDRVVSSMKNDNDGRLRCIITGGNAEIILSRLAEEFEYESNLVLHGVALISGQE